MKPIGSALWLIAPLFVLGCDRDSSATHGVAYFTGVKGFESVGGGARLEEARPGVRIVVWINQASPGPKGVHIHEKGDCTDALAGSMGKHFAPHGDKGTEPSGDSEKPLACAVIKQN